MFTQGEDPVAAAIELEIDLAAVVELWRQYHDALDLSAPVERLFALEPADPPAVVGLDPATGDVRWERPDTGLPAGAAASSGVVTATASADGTDALVADPPRPDRPPRR